MAQRFKQRFLTVENLILLGYLFGLTLFSALNFVFISTMSHKLGNYSYFCSEMPIVAYLIVFFPIVWYKQLFTQDIPLEVQTIYGKRWIFGMAFFDQCADILMIYGTAGTKLPLVPIFTQSVVPLTMVTSIIVFRRRYLLNHFLGAAIVIGGVVSSALTQPNSGSNTALGNILLISAGIPAAIAAVLKEVSFKRQQMDLYYLNAWESMFQFLFSLILTPLMAVIPPVAVPLNAIPTNIVFGFKCMVGYNSLPGDACEGAWLQVLLFVIFDILFNVFLLLVVKNGSAALMFACNTISLPLGDLFFTLPFIVGAFAMPLNKFDLIGLGVILIGLIVYRIRAEDMTDRSVLVIGGLSVAVGPVLKPDIAPRTREVIRSTYFRRLGLGIGPHPTAPPSPQKEEYITLRK
eukprot:TRINITY_DN7889_c0_g1_i1.p1 TRINITY_DN7889_c0_g1~~TRINITY_DN7889_c0_g1_i1.p1  ORF type:complete len:443 (+),score=75.19 TRINITY_DN7889_c0_g1_i1:117-1331(+)